MHPKTTSLFIRTACAAIIVSVLVVSAEGCNCNGPFPPDGVTPEGPPDVVEPESASCGEMSPCLRATDCAAGQICDQEINSDFGCCVQIICVDDSGCEENEVCDVRRGICLDQNTCDPANPTPVCGEGLQCIYVDGVPSCEEPSSLDVAVRCELAPSELYVRDGESVELRARGARDDGTLVQDPTFFYTTDLGEVIGTVLLASCAGPEVCPGVLTISNRQGEVCGTAPLTVYPPVAGNAFRVVVFDEHDGLPLARTDVAIKTPGSTTVTVEQTDLHGVAMFTWPQGQPFSIDAVTAFPQDHEWITYQSPSANDVAMFAPRLKRPNTRAGVKGRFDFSQVRQQGDVQLGLAGMAVRAPLTNLDFLLGEVASYDVVIDGLGNFDVHFPSGMEFTLGETPLKGDFVAFGAEGKNVLWALGGKSRLADIGPLVTALTNGASLNEGPVLNAALPMFSRFDSAVVTGLELWETTKEPQNGSLPFAQWPFEQRIGAASVTPNTWTALSALYQMPSLPCVAGQGATPACAANAFAPDVIVMSGVIVPGVGVVPLGVTVAHDNPNVLDDDDENAIVDGLVDYIGDNAPASGEVVVDYAPPHNGLEGNLHITVAFAVDLQTFDRASSAIATTVHITDRYAPTNTFPRSFLEHQGGKYVRDGESGQGGVRTFSQLQVGNADYYCLKLEDDTGAAWNIYYPRSAVPTAEAPLDIDALRSNFRVGRDDVASIQAFRLGSGYDGITPPSFTRLIEFNGANFDDSLYAVGASSTTPCVAQNGGDASPFCVIASE